MSLLVSSGGGGGPIAASDITDASATGISVLTGTPAQGQTALGIDNLNADIATAKAAADGQAYKQVVPMTPHQGQSDRNGQPPQGAMPQNAFHPMYKVRVTSGSVRYDVLVDATNGTVIHTEIED